MKRKIFLAVSLASLFLILSACEQVDEKETKKQEDVKIFMSGASPSGTTSKSTRTAINNGDTVDVKDIRDINLLMSAESEHNVEVEGIWSVFLIDNDLIERGSVNVHGLEFLCSKYGTKFSLKLKLLGLYQINFDAKNGASVSYYIRHTGMPGELGDDGRNDWVFRLDKYNYRVDGDSSFLLTKGYTLYLKYDQYPIPLFEHKNIDFTSKENWRALVLCDNNELFLKNGGYIKGKIYSLKTSKYSPGYICFTFLESEAPAINGQYEIYLYSGEFHYNWTVFPAISKSSWEKYGYITFKNL